MIMILSDNGGHAEPDMEGKFEGENPSSVDSKIFLGGSLAM